LSRQTAEAAIRPAMIGVVNIGEGVPSRRIDEDRAIHFCRGPSA